MRQQVSGRPKAEVVTDVATRLVDIGCRRAGDFRPTSSVQRKAWVQTTGLGPVTWSYLSMLLGNSDVKADTMVTAYVRNAIGRPHTTSEQVRAIVSQAAAHLASSHPEADSEITATTLDHAIWNYQRRAREV
jgi:hypothetical protein